MQFTKILGFVTVAVAVGVSAAPSVPADVSETIDVVVGSRNTRIDPPISQF